jgi:uncharacterized protein
LIIVGAIIFHQNSFLKINYESVKKNPENLRLFYWILGIGILGYAYFIEPFRFIVNEKSLKVPHWSRELNGFKIVAVSDIHGGSHSVTEERLQFLTEQINSQNPDVVVLLGDYVSQTSGKKNSSLKMSIETVAQNLKGLKAKYGVYVIIGNHDWWYDEKKVRSEFERVGFKVLENETSSFEINGKIVTILGIEDFWKREKVDVKNVLEKVQPNENIIGITHNPDSFDQTPEVISLLLAGHTHGGQVWIPFIGAPIPVAKKKYTAGHIIKDDRNLFVTVGFGTTGPSIRFGVPPEIAVITLNSQN